MIAELTPHSEAPELYEAVLARPADDAPRLAFAAWFDERGDPRGEFIRVQIELARGADLSPERTAGLRQRESDLLGRYRRQWNGSLHRMLSQTPLRGRVSSRRATIRHWDYSRGFVETVKVSVQTLQDHYEILFRLGPLRHVQLVGSQKQMIANLLLSRAVIALRRFETISLDSSLFVELFEAYGIPRERLRGQICYAQERPPPRRMVWGPDINGPPRRPVVPPPAVRPEGFFRKWIAWLLCRR